ncbi:DUF6507 family protein [Streptomyces sp. SCSIO 30461]|uniref:DUF6507 family protein n=1 Tax=Streptomyces sp. SCSIO 30461 TaxID=3118085 RepID=UPI0030D0CB0A
MTKWDIDPVGVLATLSTTGEAAGRLESAFDSMMKDLASAAASAGTVLAGGDYNPAAGPVVAGAVRPNVTKQPMIGPVVPGTTRPEVAVSAPAIGPVGAALNAYLEARIAKMSSMAARTGNAVKGAAEATSHYQHGNLTMADNAQEEVVRAPETLDMPGADRRGVR